MGCYGIGISRTLAAVCEQNCDESGLIWPKNIAPYSVSIIYHPEKKDDAFELYYTLQKANIEVLIDDRKLSLGSQIKDCKLLGIPNMVIIGKKTQTGFYEHEDRASGKKSYVSLDQLLKLVK